MAGRGPMPTPTATLAERGSWRAKRRTGEPQFDRGRPSCPSWLSAEGKAEWKRVVEQLDNAGVLTTADRATLAAFCDSWADYVLAAGEVAKVVKESGYAEAIRVGLVGAKAKAREALMKASDRFGLSPATRTRVKASDDGDDETPDILKGFKQA